MPLLALVLAAAAGTPSAPNCLDGRNGDAAVTLNGRLERPTFATPDVGNGRPERAFILILERRICIDDGGQFADLNNRFNRVQLYSPNPRLNARLRASVGHRIRITGRGFAAHTAHHHADLVVEVTAISAARR